MSVAPDPDTPVTVRTGSIVALTLNMPVRPPVSSAQLLLE